MRWGMVCLFLLLAGVSAPKALSAEDISCQKGQRPVFWSEQGPPEDYRDIYVFDLDRHDPDRVLQYSPASEKARWLKISRAVAGVPYRGLTAERQRADEATLLFRFIEARADKSDAVGNRQKKILGVLLLDMKLYWPVCAKSKEVARWKARAGP